MNHFDVYNYLRSSGRIEEYKNCSDAETIRDEMILGLCTYWNETTPENSSLFLGHHLTGIHIIEAVRAIDWGSLFILVRNHGR